MVNIQCVIFVSRTQTQIHPNFESYWTKYLCDSSPQGRPGLVRIRHSLQVGDRALAGLHNLSEDQVRYSSFLFGGVRKTFRQFEDIEIRDLVTNLDNKIVLQIKRIGPNLVTNIITIHTSDSSRTIESSWEIQAPLTRNPPALGSDSCDRQH